MINDNLIIQGDALKLPIAPESVHVAVTSPPYFSQRNYEIEGQLGAEPQHDCLRWAKSLDPIKGCCFVCNTRLWAAQVHRITRKDGTLWVNIGDGYAGSGGAGGDYSTGGQRKGQPKYKGPKTPGLANKNLIMIPARVALALQGDGWILRQEITWEKTGIPDSAKDRPNSNTEKIYLFSKARYYYFDWWAIGSSPKYDYFRRGEEHIKTPGRKNIGNVWRIYSTPYAGDHYATFPPELPARCIKAGTSARGVCPDCGAQWIRVVEASGGAIGSAYNNKSRYFEKGNRTSSSAKAKNTDYKKESLGWRPGCGCYDGEFYKNKDFKEMLKLKRSKTLNLLEKFKDYPTIPATVIDPFGGSGTVGAVARALGRRWILNELGGKYIDQAMNRTLVNDLKAWELGISPGPNNLEDLPLFQKG